MIKKWRRYRFYTKSIDDYRPLVFNERYPWWCSGTTAIGDDSPEVAIIVAYLPAEEDILKYWDDAYVLSIRKRIRLNLPAGFQNQSIL